VSQSSLKRYLTSVWRVPLGLAVGLVLAVGLGGCDDGPPAETPAVEVTPTSIPTPPVQVDTPSPAATPMPGSTWHLSDDYVTLASGLACAQALLEGGFILGADPATCEPGASGGAAVTTLAIPQGEGAQVTILRVTCPGAAGCAGAVSASEPGGEVAIAVDGQTLWAARCAAGGGCDPLALGEEPAVAFVADAASQHRVRLIASPHTSWAIASVQVELHEMPSLVQGIAYSPFRDCQNPHWGPFPAEEQVREDLLLVRHMGNAIRTYSSLGVLGQIPQMARQLGLRVSAGAWLGRDRETNEQEIAALIDLAQTVEVESVIVGNEVLLRGDLSEGELIDYIQWVKSAVDVPVTTAEIGGVLLDHPRVMDAVDYLMVHHYAYWDGVPVEHAARYVVEQYRQVREQAGGKRVVIGETGWPSAGPLNGSAIPGPENQRRFLREFLALAQEEDVEFYYFAAFDELWKTEGGVGPYWGMMDSGRHNKYDLQSVLVPLGDVPGSMAEITLLPTGTPGPAKAAGELFPVYTNYAAMDNHFAPSGWMGDIDTIHFDDCAQLSEAWEDRAIEIGYTPAAADPEGWAGIYWLEPEDNWGTRPGGYDLEGFAQLRFRARSAVDGVQAKFLVGGVDTGDYPSSIPEPIYAQEADGQGFVTLTSEWQEFHVDLRGADLGHVIDGFGWVAERARTPGGATVYLDDIVFDRQPPPAPAPTPTAAQPTASPAPPAVQPSPAPADAQVAFYVYSDANAPGNHFVPSGWMGDIGDVSIDQGHAGSTCGGATAIRVIYSAQGSGPSVGCESYGPPCWWSGAYWQQPENNWGRVAGAGYDLSQYQRLVFCARGEMGGERVEFGVGGVGYSGGTGAPIEPYPDSTRKVSTWVTLTTAWQEYTIDLTGHDLSHVVGGFLWATNRDRNPDGAVFHLDDIRFER
jgi:exo-beta-1,3-glucanase (GH17 family)